MDVLQAMRTFAAVVEAGSFVGAIETTGFSKPAVSRQIAELEKHLDVRLLHRTTRRLSLTDEGRTYYQRCKEILQAVDEADAEVGNASVQVQGRLRIGAPQTFGALHLAPLWGQFAVDNPLVALDIVLSDRVVDLVEEGYDLVVRIGKLPDSDLVSRPLARTRMVLCASPDYVARCGEPMWPARGAYAGLSGTRARHSRAVSDAQAVAAQGAQTAGVPGERAARPPVVAGQARPPKAIQVVFLIVSPEETINLCFSYLLPMGSPIKC